MNLFRLDASIRTEESVSRVVADTVESTWRAHHPTSPAPVVTRRDLGSEPLPSHAWRSILTGGNGPDDQAAAVALAASLVDEVVAADAYLFAVPLYNLGVPQELKTWIDLLIADPRMGPGEQPLAGRPAVLVCARGGGYGPGTPRDGWDHCTPYLRRILGDVFGLDLRIVEAELTHAEVDPAMAALRDLAAQSLAQAHARAREYGRSLADPVKV
jgi:FMN-dependent NADH-azoreductase